MLRLEIGEPPLACAVLKRALKFLAKVLTMDDTRYPKRCLVALIALDNQPENNARFNWFSQLKDLASKCAGQDVEIETEATAVLASIPAILDLARMNLLDIDLASLYKSRFSDAYSFLYTPRPGPQDYLHLKVPFNQKRLIAQIRMMGQHSATLKSGKSRRFKLSPKETCPDCPLHQDQTLFHVLFECPMYKSAREATCPYLLRPEHAIPIIRSPNELDLQRLHHFVIAVLNIRKLCLFDY